MNYSAQFLSFLESIRTQATAETVDAVIKGHLLMESVATGGTEDDKWLEKIAELVQTGTLPREEALKLVGGHFNEPHRMHQSAALNAALKAIGADEQVREEY
jgi:hypothetical protein